MKSIIFAVTFICKIILAYILGTLLVGVIGFGIGIIFIVIPIIIASKLHPLLALVYYVYAIICVCCFIPKEDTRGYTIDDFYPFNRRK